MQHHMAMSNSSEAHSTHAMYIGLGANLGDRLATLNDAIEHLATLCSVGHVSSVYETDPVGFADQPAFLNAAIALITQRAPQDVMSNLLHIERKLGRVRTFPNAPRAIDLDLLLVDDLVIDKQSLQVPHPRLHERSFVMVPLAEIAPYVMHPVLGVSVGDLLKRLEPVSGVQRTNDVLTAGVPKSW